MKDTKEDWDHLDWMGTIAEEDILAISKEIIGKPEEKEIEINYGWDRTVYTFKNITDWKIGYIFYKKVPNLTKIIKEVEKRRKKEQDVNEWVLVLPKEYIKKFSKKLSTLNVFIAEEKKNKSISTITGGKLCKPQINHITKCCLCKKRIPKNKVYYNKIKEPHHEKCFRNYYKKYVPMSELNL